MRIKPVNTILIISTLSLILGILFQENFKMTGNNLLFLLIGIVFTGFFFVLKFKSKAFIGVFLLFFGVGIITQFTHYQPNNKNHYTNILQTDTPYFLQGKITSIKGKTTIVELEKQNEKNIFGKILLSLKDSLAFENIGNSILFHTKLLPISETKNPYQFDYQTYMERKNVFWRAFTDNFHIKKSTNFSIIAVANKLQNHLAISVENSSFSTESQGIIKALLLGIRDDISQETYQTYVDAGAVHILAISGLHIGIIISILSFILHLFFKSKKHNILILCTLITFLWAYALITGLSPSVVRAVTMFSFLSIALETKRHQGVYDNLIISIFILLIFNPFYIYDVGFQLSYMAVFSVVTFQPLFNRWWYPKNGIVRFFYGILSVSFSAQVGVLPISLYYFNQFPSLFFITNLLVLPFLGIILSMGILVIFLGSLGILPHFLAIGYDFLIRMMNASISWVASYNNFVLRQIYFDATMLIISFLVIILMAFWLHFKHIGFLQGTLIGVLCFQMILFYNKYTQQNTTEIIVFQQNKPLIGIYQNQKLTLLHSETNGIPSKYIVNFITKRNIKSVDIQKVNSIFSFAGKTFLILNENWYPDASFGKIDYVILSNTPKIHLEKLLQHIDPQMIIADGSNRRFLVERWKETCKKENIPFHSTSEKGYFSIIFNN